MIITSTLSRGSLPGLAGALRALDLSVLEKSLLRFTPVGDWTELDAALTQREQFSAVVLSSPRAARAVRERLRALPPHVTRGLPPLWAVGPATAAVLAGVATVRIPSLGSDARSLTAQILEAGLDGPVLYPCGESHREELPSSLAARGVPVKAIVCYRAELASGELIAAVLAETDVVLIGSHRVLTAVADVRPKERPHLLCLGPATARTARGLGWPPWAIAVTPTVAGVRQALQSVSASFQR